MWSDRETTNDCLGFEAYVDSLATVCLEPEIAPLTLGVFGSWGSGKTSLMKMLQARIAAHDKVKTVWANAWRYEGKDEIQSALIHSIIGKLEEEKGLLADAKDVLERLKKGASILKLGKFISKTMLTLSPDIEGLINCFKEESEKLAETMARFESDFEILLKKVDVARVVVFIDDLDRCQSAKVVETFETIKLFLDIPECTFVIGADAAKIEQAIRDFYRLDGRALESEQPGGRTFAEDYMEKIVQIPFRIPEQGLCDIACYVGMLALQGQLGKEAWQELISARRKLMVSGGALHECFVAWLAERDDASFKISRADALTALQRSQPYVSILARGLRGNPRQIKRFLNILELRQRLAKANDLSIAEDVLIKVLVLEYTWRWFFQEVAENFDDVTGRSELLAELVRLHTEGSQEDPDSSVLTRALSTPGLPEFLRDVPALHELNLTPYLFLAQTALHVRPTTLTPPDEVARVLADKVSDPDRIRSKAAAREAAKADGVVAAAVARTLVSKLQTETDPRVQVHIVNGLATICGGHPACLQMSIDGLLLVAASVNEAAAVAAVPLMQAAERAGIDIATVRERLGGRSKIAKALDIGSGDRSKGVPQVPRKG
jgi:hypothetical protein